jgi:hypothetical protein
VLAGVVLGALVLASFAAGRWGALGAVPLGLVSALWLLVNRPVEGRTLVEVSSQHGLTVADLAGVTGLGLAGMVLWRSGGGP